MKHDINKELRDYKALTNQREPFYLTDIAQVYDSARTAAGEADTATAIMNALMAGYSIGYKAAIKEAK